MNLIYIYMYIYILFLYRGFRSRLISRPSSLGPSHHGFSLSWSFLLTALLCVSSATLLQVWHLFTRLSQCGFYPLFCVGMPHAMAQPLLSPGLWPMRGSFASGYSNGPFRLCAGNWFLARQGSFLFCPPGWPSVGAWRCHLGSPTSIQVLYGHLELVSFGSAALGASRPGVGSVWIWSCPWWSAMDLSEILGHRWPY